VLREALADGLLGADPSLGVKRVKPLRTEHPGQALDFEQAARLRALGQVLFEAGLSRLWPALFCCLSVGLRRGEVMALRWCDIDLEQAELRVAQNLTAQKGKGVVVGATKTTSSQRQVLLPGSLVVVLRAHQVQLRAELEASGLPWRDDGPVFPTVNGHYTHPDNLDRSLSSLLRWSNPEATSSYKGDNPRPMRERSPLERRLKVVAVAHRALVAAMVTAGPVLPDISPHDLRHTAGTLMLRRGVPIEVVSKTLGHADISITYRVYRHVLESEKRQHVVDLFA
jgi:integrase